MYKSEKKKMRGEGGMAPFHREGFRDQRGTKRKRERGHRGQGMGKC